MEMSLKDKARGDQFETDEPNSTGNDYLSYPIESVEEMLEGAGTLALFHARLREQYRWAAFRFWEPPPVDLPLPYPWDRDRDRRVLEAVLLYFVDDTKKTSDTADQNRHPPPDSTVIVDDKNTMGSFEESYDPDLLPGRDLTHAAADLLRRNSEGPVPLAEFKFRSRQIVIDDLDRIGEGAYSKHPDGVGFVRVCFPATREMAKSHSSRFPLRYSTITARVETSLSSLRTENGRSPSKTSILKSKLHDVRKDNDFAHVGMKQTTKRVVLSTSGGPCSGKERLYEPRSVGGEKKVL